MGLDKWLQSDKDEKNKSKQPATVSSDKKQQRSKKNETVKSKIGVSKFILICANSKCRYQKVLMKRVLASKDKTCPKCKSEMKVKHH